MEIRNRVILACLLIALAVSVSISVAWYVNTFPKTTNIIIKAISRNRYINNTGQVAIVTLQVYWNSDGTNATTFIDWGTLEPSGSYNKTIYVKNEGNVPINVSFCAIDWIPSEASLYMTFDCDTEYNIAPNEIRQVLFVLNIGSDIQSIYTFNFTTLVVGEG